MLVVFNHPMWDICRAGFASHQRSIQDFLQRNLSFVHAVEVNGMRSWQENQKVLELAEAWQCPVVSGGDRHGCEPSANLNLTRASSFAEFAKEIREDRYTHVLFMPQYQQNLELRMVHTFLDVIREYPGHPLGANWDRRVFHPDPAGVVQPLSELWRKPPEFIETIFSAFRLLEASPVQRFTRFALGRSHNALRMPLRPGGEAACNGKYPRVAFFACAYNEVDGVANTVHHFEAYAARRHLPFLSIHGGYESYRQQEDTLIKVEFAARVGLLPPG